MKGNIFFTTPLQCITICLYSVIDSVVNIVENIKAFLYQDFAKRKKKDFSCSCKMSENTFQRISIIFPLFFDVVWFIFLFFDVIFYSMVVKLCLVAM